ncbi:MAG: hypothetical protein KAI71_02715 [Candidatus Pacebacteria bacterium]|nr:hypothetical protein [Candidatus Paceibacterota bacterium]
MADSDDFGGSSGEECHGDVFCTTCSKCKGLNCPRIEEEEESFDTLVAELI